MSAAVAEANSLTRKLWQIAGTGDLEQFNELLNQGADVNAGDRTGVTALMRAAYHGQLAMVRTLIEHGAEPNAKDGSGLTALTMAKHAGHQDIVEALLTFGGQAESKATKPRQDRPAHDERIHPAINHEVTRARALEVKTLQEPPDIWDLVHTTQTETDSPPFSYSPSTALRKSVSIRTGAFAAVVLIICAGIGFAVVSLLRPGNAAEKPEQAKAIEPISPTQRKSTAKAGSAKPNHSKAAIELTKIPFVGELGERTHQLTIAPTATEVSTKKPAAIERNKATASFSRQNKNVRPTRPETEESTDSRPANKERSPTANDPVKPTATQKPKVIQWP